MKATRETKALGVILVIGVIAACGKTPTVVARLDEAVATVERMPEANAAWQPASPGDTFVIGSGVRTGKASMAHLRVGTRGKLSVDPESIVYFRTQGASDRQEVRVETGRVELEAGEEPMQIGAATLESGGRAEITQTADGTAINVKIGRVILEDSAPLKAGERAVVDREGKRIVADKPPPPPIARPPSNRLIVKVTGKATVKTTGAEMPLDAGDHQLEPGAKIRVSEGSSVDVTRGDSRLSVAGPGELTLGGSAETLATVASGGVALKTADPAAVAVPGGVIAVRGGEASAQVDRDGSTIGNRRGETTIRAKSVDNKLAVGDLASLAADGTVVVLPPPPARSVVTITAGESPTLHDARAPTPLRLKFPDGCAAGLVEVAKDRALRRLAGRSFSIGGSASANVLIAAGSWHYRVRCDGGKQLRGTITVARDSGRAPLPKTAARTLVEMDGREYTIHYQNLLPELTLSWRNAAFSVGYTFVVKSATSEKRFSSPAAKRILRPGEIAEGSYKVWVEPSGGGSRSETSRIVIEFDNATPGVQLDQIDRVDGKLLVKGTVIEGSTVTTSTGAAIELDRHRRFNAELVVAAGEDGVGVRIAHPKLGIHYYVLRAAP